MVEGRASRAKDTVSEKLDVLLRTVRHADGRPLTYDDVELGTQRRVSRSYVWKLRNGRNRNPSLDVIEALSEFFAVPPAYFFEPWSEDPDRTREAAEAAFLLRDPGVRQLAERARGLSPAALQAVLGLVDALRMLDARDGGPVTLAAAPADEVAPSAVLAAGDGGPAAPPPGGHVLDAPVAPPAAPVVVAAGREPRLPALAPEVAQHN